MYKDITDKAYYWAPSDDLNISLYANNPKGKGNKKKGNSSGSSGSDSSKRHCNHYDYNGHLEDEYFKKHLEKKAVYDTKWAQWIKDCKEQKE